MSEATAYVNGAKVGVTTTTNANGESWFTLDPSITVKNGEAIHFTYTTSTSGGDWLTGDPDMTDWPASDIIDHFAQDLARKRPA